MVFKFGSGTSQQVSTLTAKPPNLIPIKFPAIRYAGSYDVHVLTINEPYELYLSQYPNQMTCCYIITGLSHEQPFPSPPSPITNWTNQVLDIGVQDQLRAHLSTMRPRPSIYCPDFIAANQEDRADNVLSGT